MLRHPGSSDLSGLVVILPGSKSKNIYSDRFDSLNNFLMNLKSEQYVKITVV